MIVRNQDKIRYFSINWNSRKDGKGIRTVLFLQGCNLSCPWCHSPHSQAHLSPVLFYEQNCSMCGTCAEVCSQSVHIFKNQSHIVNTETCISCGRCVKACQRSQNVQQKNLNALDLPTKMISPQELFEMLLPQLSLLKRCGGLTISGGEPMLQYRNLKPFLKLCKSACIPVTIETSASVPFYFFEEIKEYVDDWLFGIRPVSDSYSEYVADLNLVIDNLKQLSDYTRSITIRVPLIQGVTDGYEHIGIILKQMQKNQLKDIELLPYNPYTDHYYKALGRSLSLIGDCELSKEQLQGICDRFLNANINAKIIQF